MERLEVSFESEGVMLDGIINLSDIDAPFVILIPGISGEALSDRFEYISTTLNEVGINFFRFNFRGYQGSNKLEDFNLESELIDLNNAINFLANTGYNTVNIGLIGKSFGGLRSLLINEERIKAVVLLAPAAFFGETSNIDVMKSVEYGLVENVKNYVIGKDFFDNYYISTMIIHGDNDEIVSIDNSKYIYDNLKGKKEFVELKGADHSMRQPQDQKTLEVKFKDFFKTNLL